MKNSKKFLKIIWKISNFLAYFLSIFYNIRLYIYTVRYGFDIKIPDFLWNVS
jgi:hypothetical protein